MTHHVLDRFQFQFDNCYRRCELCSMCVLLISLMIIIIIIITIGGRKCVCVSALATIDLNHHHHQLNEVGEEKDENWWPTIDKIFCLFWLKHTNLPRELSLPFLLLKKIDKYLLILLHLLLLNLHLLSYTMSSPFFCYSYLSLVLVNWSMHLLQSFIDLVWI